MAEGQAITPLEPVKPLVSPEQASKGREEFEALKTSLLRLDDYQTIAGKAYIKKSGWRMLAVYFGISDRIIESERREREDGSFTWRIVAEARAPNGRTSVGVAICDSAERKFSHAEHNTYSTAHTRAKNRAISDLVAGGQVSAEELEADEKPAQVSSREIGASEALERAGIDPELVEIRQENGTINIYPTRGLVDWVGAKTALAVAGFVWDAEKRKWSKK
jgi:hypothetical protein